jgi:hypothetical protein
MANPALQRASIVNLAAKKRLPAVYCHRLYVVDGGLMSYAAESWKVRKPAAGASASLSENWLRCSGSTAWSVHPRSVADGGGGRRPSIMSQNGPVRGCFASVIVVSLARAASRGRASAGRLCYDTARWPAPRS